MTSVNQTKNNSNNVFKNNFSNEPKKYLTTKELAKHLSISESTLISYRANECGPAYIKIGRMVRYDINEVTSWIKIENGKSTKTKLESENANIEQCINGNMEQRLNKNPSVSEITIQVPNEIITQTPYRKPYIKT